MQPRLSRLNRRCHAKSFSQCLFIFSLLFFSLSTQAQPQSILLTGHDLTIENVVAVARQHVAVVVDSKALTQVEKSHQLLLLAAAQDIPVYGLNRGVGLNKDKTIFKGSVLTPTARKLSEQFNLQDLHATSAAIGAPAAHDVVRAAMLARLNTLLLGNAGVQPQVITMFVDFLNKDITPVFPSGGSMGEADITILSHIGLAMTGEGEVFYKHKRMSASSALKLAGLQPLHPYAKDALSIFSSNAYTAGMGALVTYDLEKLLNKYDLLVSLSLEGLNGNIAPFLEPVHAIRPYPGQGFSAQQILNNLHGSYLFELSKNRALQDPLSFRTASQVNGAVRDILQVLKQNLTIQLNSSDDNPAVILGISPSKNATPQEKAYYVNNKELAGAIIPTANFEPISWVLNFEELNIALSHLSANSVQRTIKLSGTHFTHLSRFLSPDETTIAFGAIQKPLLYLNTIIQQNSIPVSVISYPVAGEIEDTATNSLLVVMHTHKIIHNLYQVMGFELIHASQAVDLRKIQTPDLKLGDKTAVFFADFRKQVTFLQHDRILTPDIEKAHQFICTYPSP